MIQTINRLISSHKLLILILLIGAFVRFYNLDSVPIALNGDEAGFGYNAYAIGHSLKDEHGQFLPFVFKSFGDYKPPIFVYILVPITALFGLNELVVRVPIAICGTLLIFFTYLISMKIFSNRLAALLAALFVAISPWAINFSRAAWEAGLALLLTTVGIYFSLLATEKRKWLIAAISFLMLGFYSYHSEKVSTPLIILAVWYFFKDKFAFSKKQLFTLILILFVLALPALIGITNMSGQSRARGSLVLEYLINPTQTKYYNFSSVENESNDLVQNVIGHSRVALSFSDITSKIFAYLSPAQLFVYGDEVGRHGVLDFGVLYVIDFLFLIFAIYYFIKKKKDPYDKFLIFWLIVGLLPAMITMDKLHSIRSLLALPPLYILESWGLVKFLEYLKANNRKLIIPTIVLFSLFTFIGFMRFLDSYFIYTPIERAEWWQYGYKEVVQTVAKEQDRFQEVIVDVPAIYGNPYIFFLYYQQYDPTLYNQTVKREDNLIHKNVPVFSFGKYHFSGVFWPTDRDKKKTLFVGTNFSIPKEDINDPEKFRLIKEIKMPDGKVVFRIVETL